MCMLKSVCACVRIYACMYMYDVLVEIGGREKKRIKGVTGLEPATNMRRESRLVLHQIVCGGTGMYTSWHI